MEKYAPLLIVVLAFITAVWSYVYYADYQYVNAKNRIQTAQEQIVEPQEKIIKVRAKHILVKSLEEAEKLRNEIFNGKTFEKAARESSICPSGKIGGDLGYVERGRMVQEFEKAVFSLPENEISQPVKTEFGWHLIKVTDIIKETK